MRKPPIDIKIRKMSVKKLEVDFSNIDICERCYLAALIDGEGAIGIHIRDLYPLICVGMRSLFAIRALDEVWGMSYQELQKGRTILHMEHLR